MLDFVYVVFVLVWQSLDYVTVQFFAKSSCLKSHLTVGCIAADLRGLLRNTDVWLRFFLSPPPSSPPLFPSFLPLPFSPSFSSSLSPSLSPHLLPLYFLMKSWMFSFNGTQFVFTIPLCPGCPYFAQKSLSSYGK